VGPVSNEGDASRRGPRQAAILFALIAGLFAMHGLADHGTSHAMVSEPGMAMHSLVDSPIAMAMPAPYAAATARSSSLPGSGSGPMAAMCVVALLVGLALVLALSGRAEALRYAVQRAAPSCTWSALRSRAPDPPDLTRLGLCRC
jgi:hypothetical protein